MRHVNDSAEELHNLARVLAANATALRKAADAARQRGALLKEMAQITRWTAGHFGAKREQTEAARRRQETL
jgi:hypothetical protein